MRCCETDLCIPLMHIMHHTLCMPRLHLSPRRLLTRYLDDGEQLGYVTARGSRLVFDALLRKGGDPANPGGGAWSGSLQLSWPGAGACGGNASWPPLDAVAFLGVSPPVDLSTAYCMVRPTAAAAGVLQRLGGATAWVSRMKCCYWSVWKAISELHRV